MIRPIRLHISMHGKLALQEVRIDLFTLAQKIIKGFCELAAITILSGT